MREYTGPRAKGLKIASLIGQENFSRGLGQLNRIQLKSAIDSFLAQGHSIPLTMRECQGNEANLQYT